MSGALPPVVVFDLDGTLVDSVPGLEAALGVVLGELGRRPLTRAEVCSFVGEGLDLLLSRALAATGAPGDPAPLRARWFEVYGRTARAGTTPYPGAEAMLAELQAAGCRLGICTNKPQGPTEQILDMLGWQPFFGAVLGADAVPRRKPDPDHLLRVVAALGGGRAAYVGDSPTDVEAARGAGLPVVVLTHGYSRVDPHALGADAVVNDLAEVPAALRRLQ